MAALAARTEGWAAGLQEPEYLVLARVLLAQDRPGPALALLARLLAAAVSQDRAGSVIEIQALRALALAAAGEETRAVDVLAAALALACRRAMSGCSPTRARRWPRCWARWSRPSGQTTPLRAASRSAAWPACCRGSAARTTRRAPCLLEHLATLTRNQVRFAGTRATVPVLAEPTSAQREAFDLIGAPIPLTLR